MRVLFSHPHSNANAAAAVRALEATGQLSRFVTGIAAAQGTLPALALRAIGSRFPAALNRVFQDLAPAHMTSLALVELAVRVAGRAARSRPGLQYDALYVGHDLACAGLPWPDDVDTVYAFEDAARFTFEKARRKDLRRIWDLPIPHWETLSSMWQQEFQRWPGAMGIAPHTEPPWKLHRKQQELDLADHISVASTFTRDSLLAAGCAKPITVTPYAFPLEEFRPRPHPPNGRFTVLAVGTQDLRKGTPYLLEAFKKAELPEAELLLVGPMRLDPSFVAPYQGLFRHVPHAPRRQLPGLYAQADLLAFPTLCDGFGLVIQEAMCTAVPVLTTPCGGGPECITHATDGWITPARDVDTMVDVLRWAHSQRDTVARMGQAARHRAERWDWRVAGQAMWSRLGAGGAG